MNLRIKNLRKPTEEEINHYHSDCGFSLCKIATCFDGTILNIEKLEGSFAKNGGPKYEVMAPNNFNFMPDFCHSLLCYNMLDVHERVNNSFLEACSPICLAV